MLQVYGNTTRVVALRRLQRLAPVQLGGLLREVSGGGQPRDWRLPELTNHQRNILKELCEQHPSFVSLLDRRVVEELGLGRGQKGWNKLPPPPARHAPQQPEAAAASQPSSAAAAPEDRRFVSGSTTSSRRPLPPRPSTSPHSQQPAARGGSQLSPPSPFSKLTFDRLRSLLKWMAYLPPRQVVLGEGSLGVEVDGYTWYECTNRFRHACLKDPHRFLSANQQERLHHLLRVVAGREWARQQRDLQHWAANYFGAANNSGYTAAPLDAMQLRPESSEAWQEVVTLVEPVLVGFVRDRLSALIKLGSSHGGSAHSAWARLFQPSLLSGADLRLDDPIPPFPNLIAVSKVYTVLLCGRLHLQQRLPDPQVFTDAGISTVHSDDRKWARDVRDLDKAIHSNPDAVLTRDQQKRVYAIARRLRDLDSRAYQKRMHRWSGNGQAQRRSDGTAAAAEAIRPPEELADAVPELVDMLEPLVMEHMRRLETPDAQQPLTPPPPPSSSGASGEGCEDDTVIIPPFAQLIASQHLWSKLGITLKAMAYLPPNHQVDLGEGRGSVHVDGFTWYECMDRFRHALMAQPQAILTHDQQAHLRGLLQHCFVHGYITRLLEWSGPVFGASCLHGYEPSTGKEVPPPPTMPAEVAELMAFLMRPAVEYSRGYLYAQTKLAGRGRDSRFRYPEVASSIAATSSKRSSLRELPSSSPPSPSSSPSPSPPPSSLSQPHASSPLAPSTSPPSPSSSPPSPSPSQPAEPTQTQSTVVMWSAKAADAAEAIRQAFTGLWRPKEESR